MLKIIADKDRIYNDLDTTYKKLGAKHIVLVNKFVDLKILYGNLKAENKALKGLLDDAQERIDLLKGLRKKSLIEIIEENKKILKAEYQRGYAAGGVDMNRKWLEARKQ